MAKLTEDPFSDTLAGHSSQSFGIYLCVKALLSQRNGAVTFQDLL